jgi:dTDP-4-amino-4,6-dideoxygalactose transaminase
MIRMNDFTAEPEEVRARENAAISRVLSSGHYILGREVEAFEKSWAAFCGTKHCVGVANGMEAIELALRALGIGGGDEVITTPMTAIATVLAILHAGATPVLADIDPQTALLNRESVARVLTKRTKALLPVHLYGRLPDMDLWSAFCKDAGIHLVEDCAQAHGARFSGKSAGAFGEVSAFSFYPTKNLGAKGDAGAVVTNSSAIAERVRSLRNLGATSRYVHNEAGLNSRLDEVQAAILSERLPFLAAFNARRHAIAHAYQSGITNPAIEHLVVPKDSAAHVYHLFVIRTPERDRLAEFLKSRGIETLVHYPVPAHRQECCRNIRCDSAGLPNAEAHAKSCLSLPCHPQLTDEEVRIVVAAVNEFR